MEAFIGLILLVAAIAAMIFFKDVIKKSAKYTEDVVNTNISEAQYDLVKRSNVAYEKIVEEFGEDFMTPEEIYNRINKKKIRKTIPNNKRSH